MVKKGWPTFLVARPFVMMRRKSVLVLSLCLSAEALSSAEYYSLYDQTSSSSRSLKEDDHLLVLEGEESASFGGIEQKEWWGAMRPERVVQSRAQSEDEALRSRSAEQQPRQDFQQLRRMSKLMRRQLQPQEFSFSFSFEDVTAAPTVTLSPAFSPLPTTMPTPLPTPLPSPMPSPLVGVPTFEPGTTAAPTTTPAPTTFTPAPTTFGSTQAVLLLSSVLVDDVPEDFFEDEDIGLLIIQNSINDVSDIVEDPDSVLDAEVEFQRRRLQAAEDATALVEFSTLVDTCGEAGFTSNDFCADAYDQELTDSAESGELAERINYWASYFGVGTVGGVIPQENVTTWVFAPTAAPTPDVPVPTLSPEPSAAPTGSPAPSSSPKPTETFAPTTTPKPSISPAPTSSPKPTTSPKPTITFAPTSAAPTASPAPTTTMSPTPEATSAPAVSRGSSKKKNNNNNQATLIIVLVVVAIILCCCCLLGYYFWSQKQRKATERKDSWDISTMFTDEANLPPAEEVVAVEDDDDNTDGGEGAVVMTGAGGAEEGQLVPLEDEEPQELQKITQAAEL